MQNSDPLVGVHQFVINKKDNGGEALTLITRFHDNGDRQYHIDKIPKIGADEGVYWNQEIKLQSYSNEASISLCGASLTPEILRELADELENAHRKAVCDYDMKTKIKIMKLETQTQKGI